MQEVLLSCRLYSWNTRLLPLQPSDHGANSISFSCAAWFTRIYSLYFESDSIKTMLPRCRRVGVFSWPFIVAAIFVVCLVNVILFTFGKYAHRTQQNLHSLGALTMISGNLITLSKSSVGKTALEYSFVIHRTCNILVHLTSAERMYVVNRHLSDHIPVWLAAPLFSAFSFRPKLDTQTWYMLRYRSE